MIRLKSYFSFFSLFPTMSYSNFFIPTMRFLCATVWENRRNALAQELETSWIPECGALQESPESPTWTSSRFPWQRRTNRRKHWGNPVILQHWTIINTQSGEGSRSRYSSNPYRALGRGASYQSHCWCGRMFLNRKGVCAQLPCRSLNLNVYRVFLSCFTPLSAF